METHPFTCLTCSLAFTTATAQREHYVTDLHRYNSKRVVASLPPVTADVYNSKVVESRVVEGEQGPSKLNCKACHKTFNSAATHQAHLTSRKHKENEVRYAASLAEKLSPSASTEDVKPAAAEEEVVMADAVASSSSAAGPSTEVAEEAEEPTFESSGDAAMDRLVARRLLASPPVPPTACLFCLTKSATPEENADHMRAAHSFAIPERAYLVDLEGLLRRLGEEVGTWNVCICCGKGYGGSISLDEDVSEMSPEEMKKKSSKGLEGVRRHMIDKSHCRLMYDTEEQKLELSDFYDFRSSYGAVAKAKKAQNEGWEDVDGDEEMGDDVEVYEDVDDDDSELDSDDELPESQITYGDSVYELVLPSGARIGSKAHKHIFKQNLAPYMTGNPFASSSRSPNKTFKPSPASQSLLKLVPVRSSRNANAGKSHMAPLHTAGLISAKGAGLGGTGDVIKARNKGEAKEAARQYPKILKHAYTPPPSGAKTHLGGG